MKSTSISGLKFDFLKLKLVTLDVETKKSQYQKKKVFL